MSFKASSSATIFLCFNILFVLLVSNRITCEAPVQEATNEPAPADNSEPTSDPAPATDPEPTPNSEPSSNPAPADDSPPNSTATAPPAAPSCSINPIRTAYCIRFLSLPVVYNSKPCCETLSSFLQIGAQACVCPVIKSIERFGITVANATSDIVLNRCGINGTINFQCA